MSRFRTSIAGLILTVALGSCVTGKVLDERLAAERKASEARIQELQSGMAAQNREIIILKDSVRAAAEWKRRYEQHLENIYDNALLARDMRTATYALQALVTENAENYTWAYDSLAFYHYFHTSIQELARNTATVHHMIKKGLDINPDNLFLKEMKARVFLIEQRDTASITLFRELFDSTGDYTYQWYATYIELMRGNVKKAETVIRKVLNDNPVTMKKVRLDHLPEHLQEKAPVRAAFLYLRSMVEQSKQQYQASVNTLKEAMKVYPDFYLAAKGLEEIRQASQGMYR